jgi:hypothetical protein
MNAPRNWCSGWWPALRQAASLHRGREGAGPGPPGHRSELGDGAPVKSSVARGIGTSTLAPGSADEDEVISGHLKQTVLGLEAVKRRRTGRPCSECGMNTKASADLRPHVITGRDLGDQPRSFSRPHPRVHLDRSMSQPSNMSSTQAANTLQPTGSSQYVTTSDAKVSGTIMALPLVKERPCLFTQQRSVPDGVGVERLPPTARPWDGGLPEGRNSSRRAGCGHPVVPAKILVPGSGSAWRGLSRCAG